MSYRLRSNATRRPRRAPIARDPDPRLFLSYERQQFARPGWSRKPMVLGGLVHKTAQQLVDECQPSVPLESSQRAVDMRSGARWHEESGRHVRHFSSCSYAAETWERQRHIVIKAEHGERGANPRFVVTSLDGFSPQLIYDRAYCGRGNSENFIKDFKNALAADRLSCGAFKANFFRLLLHAAAYRLMYAVRLAAVLVAPELGRVQFDTLRLRLLKVAAHVTQSVRRILIRLPRVFPLAAAFRALAGHLARPAPA